MPFLSRETLQAWIAEFQALGHRAAGTVRVIEQDGSEGANTGLVAVELSSGLRAYLQPNAEERWIVTLDAREEPLELEAGDVAVASSELASVSALCTFLQAKST